MRKWVSTRQAASTSARSSALDSNFMKAVLARSLVFLTDGFFDPRHQFGRGGRNLVHHGVSLCAVARIDVELALLCIGEKCLVFHEIVERPPQRGDAIRGHARADRQPARERRTGGNEFHYVLLVRRG